MSRVNTHYKRTTMMAGTAWRRAATLVLSGRGAGDELALLMVRRSGKSRHLPDVEVFPGGIVDDSDFSAAWRPLLTALPLEPLLLSAPRPATFVERPPVGDELPAEIGFRLAALRETFEETGVLLTRPAAGGRPAPLPVAEAERWRPLVQRRPAELLRLARELAVAPDVWSLHEWSAWLTPVAVPGHRHDAAFFVASVPDRPPCCEDQTETEHVEWRRPAAVLADHAAGTTTLMPPQLYELSRLQRFGSWSALERFSRRRASLGIQRMLPVVALLSDGHRLGLLPGDELYPAEGEPAADPLAEPAPLRLPMTLAQAETPGGRWHRTVMGRSSHCTVQLPYGHVGPAYPADRDSAGTPEKYWVGS
ncbi:nucleoside diphosphate-linked moiety X motif 19-like [Amphibalanus amphitrite]|uniref:nucleoside diphosphate-linked moiety X motif 19-like n=1 Tax=Amphibalanus amphitrite TaxID=1232801 RepID=UPI001C9028C2|nr:nucleoside diphosphate-linked moiety X motif 19-like [Amphibalanus amphitrite]